MVNATPAFSQDTGTAGDGAGTIGLSDAGNADRTANLNAIDVQVRTLAARSAVTRSRRTPVFFRDELTGATH